MRVLILESNTCAKLTDLINDAIRGKQVVDIKFQIEQNTFNTYKALIMYN